MDVGRFGAQFRLVFKSDFSKKNFPLLVYKGRYSLPVISLPDSSLPDNSLPDISLPDGIWQILSGKPIWQIFYLVKISQNFFFVFGYMPYRLCPTHGETFCQIEFLPGTYAR